jgi:hypothetical protein
VFVLNEKEGVSKLQTELGWYERAVSLCLNQPSDPIFLGLETPSKSINQYSEGISQFVSACK